MDSNKKRCAGATRIKDVSEGRGNTLKFVDVPDSMSGTFLEELCGLDSMHTHPLKGAVYFTKNTGPDTFSVTIFQNDLEKDLAEAYAKWFMGHCYMEWADEETRMKVSAAKKSAAGTKMFMTLKRDHGALDAAGGRNKRVTILMGRYEIERIPNPLFNNGTFWLVLKGTLVGATEGSWRQWEKGQVVDKEGHPDFGKPIDWGDFEVVIEE